MSRAEAARLRAWNAGAARTPVVRYNTEGLAGLRNRPHPVLRRAGRAVPAALRRWCWTGRTWKAPACPPGPCRTCAGGGAALGVRYHPGHMSKLLRGLGLSRQKARPAHPKVDLEAQAAFAKRAPRGAGSRRRGASGKRLTLWCQTRPGSARRPSVPSLVHPRPAPAGVVRPALHLGPPVRRRAARDRPGFALVLPAANTDTMQVFLDGFAAQLAPDEHAAVSRPRAGWHGAHYLAAPGRHPSRPSPPTRRNEPGRTRLAVLSSLAPPLPPPARRLRRHRRRLLRRLEPTHPAMLHSLTNDTYLQQVSG